MRAPPWSLKQQGVSPIVGEIIMIAVVAMAMSVIAYAVISASVTPPRDVELDVRLENAGEPQANSIKIVLVHMGGDALGIPRGAEDEFRVFVSHSGENSWENIVPWDNWVFSDAANGFQLGENAVGYITHPNATIDIGDKVGITIVDLVSKEWIYDRTLEVKDSSLYD